jgi:hypothetical protein
MPTTREEIKAYLGLLIRMVPPCLYRHSTPSFRYRGSRELPLFGATGPHEEELARE